MDNVFDMCLSLELGNLSKFVKVSLLLAPSLKPPSDNPFQFLVLLLEELAGMATGIALCFLKFTNVGHLT